jgi:hypothetical protein
MFERQHICPKLLTQEKFAFPDLMAEKTAEREHRDAQESP